MLQVGIVGLPNVGKSTLFNAITRTRNAQAANYPFCTIEPNVGIVTVPDIRLDKLSELSRAQKKIPAVIEFVDIAGLVKGASQGEGLGNQFLAHIRQANAIVQVVRCFEDENVHHVSGTVNPLSDIEVINTELILADLTTVQKRQERLQKQVRAADREAKKELDLLQKLEPHLNKNLPARTFSFTDDEKKIISSLHLLSQKPTLFACNVAETDLATALENVYVKQVKDYVAQHLEAEIVVISAQIEADLVDLSAEESSAYLKELGVLESGVGSLIRGAYHLLGLQTYFTTGEKETRAWTIYKGDTAPKAAGVIHTDFERGFIAAETTAYEDLMALGSFAKARETGKLRLEGKEYIVKDGDVMEFRFNV